MTDKDGQAKLEDTSLKASAPKMCIGLLIVWGDREFMHVIILRKLGDHDLMPITAEKYYVIDTLD